MPNYRVTLTLMGFREYEVEADNETEAGKQAKQDYYDGAECVGDYVHGLVTNVEGINDEESGDA